MGGSAEFLARDLDVHQRCSIVRERDPQRFGQVVRVLDSLSVHPERGCDRGEVGIVELGSEVDEPVCLHLELDEAERTVVEDDDLHRQLPLLQGDQVAEHHREPAVAGERDDLPPGLRGLHSDGLGHGVRHGAVIERPDETAAPVHVQVAGGPDHRCTDVDEKDGVVGGELVDRPRHELRMQRAPLAMVHRELVQSFPRFD